MAMKPGNARKEDYEYVRRVRFHYTPKHASWLNMAEIEIGVLTRQCLNTRCETRDALRRNV